MSGATPSRSRALACAAGLAVAGGATGCGDARVVGTFAKDGGSAGDGAAADGSAGPRVVIHVKATTAPVAHTDGFSGQTPKDEHVGYRALHLLATKDDPSPLVVFDNGAFTEARLNDGDDTVIARVPAASLRAGNYAWARTFVTHARYKVNATVHNLGTAVAGEYENLLVLADGVDVAGKVRRTGDAQSIFRGAGQTFGPTEGTMVLPARWESGGITLEIAGGKASYLYAANIKVDPTITSDVHVTFEVNMHECFRWEDLPTPSYQPGVWDVELTSYEPVKQFGANSFALSAK